MKANLMYWIGMKMRTDLNNRKVQLKKVIMMIPATQKIHPSPQKQREE